VTTDTADDLLDAVLASLERLQYRLGSAESAELHALWNEPGRKGVATPKDENVLSDVVHDWLKRDLGPNGGVVLNREVKATLLSRLDIKIEALPTRASAEPLTLVVEVKGHWHREVTTALRDQLVKRYLLPNRWTHGIYLVGWFQSEGCRRTTVKTAWPPDSLVTARQLVERWAQAESASGLVIRSFLLDCRLQKSQPLQRPLPKRRSRNRSALIQSRTAAA
jgi:hypothetical protein